MRIVEVTWLDPKIVLTGWHNKEDIEPDDYQPRPCTTIGYLYIDQADLIVVVSSEGDDEIGDGLALPRGVITNMRTLEPKSEIRAA